MGIIWTVSLAYFLEKYLKANFRGIFSCLFRIGNFYCFLPLLLHIPPHVLQWGNLWSGIPSNNISQNILRNFTHKQYYQYYQTFRKQDIVCLHFYEVRSDMEKIVMYYEWLCKAFTKFMCFIFWIVFTCSVWAPNGQQLKWSGVQINGFSCHTQTNIPTTHNQPTNSLTNQPTNEPTILTHAVF